MAALGSQICNSKSSIIREGDTLCFQEACQQYAHVDYGLQHLYQPQHG